MSTRQPGYRFSHQVPPAPAFFSITVKGMPARPSRMAASSPDMPAPITTTWNPARRSSGTSSTQWRSRPSDPSSSSSSSSSGTYSSGMSEATRWRIMVSTVPAGGGGGSTHPASR